MDYYCITTTYQTDKPVTAELTGSRYGLSHRPIGCHKCYSDKDTYEDWYTAAEIRRNFPDIAKKYAF